MASLYIKDPEINAQASRLAKRAGITKTEAVRRGLAALEQTLPPDTESADEFVERLRAWQRAHPLGEPTGLEADKPFYDSLYDDS